ncbi:hypothetical protein KP509_07G037800 [Ceratopteris richardii]|nr:hypothetical protein KP509_07G037800 [Ceratopteris richardii]
MYVDNGFASRLGRPMNNAQTSKLFMGRLAVLMLLVLIFNPFLWVWTILGSLWFMSAKDCISEGQKWGFLVWLLLNYCGLICIACLSAGKWLIRRQAHRGRHSHGAVASELHILLDLIRVPDIPSQHANLGHMVVGPRVQAVTHHPGLFSSQNQKEAVETLIQQLPKFQLNATPMDCNDCSICLEDFRSGDEVRGLPCAHNFHVGCIDKWLRLNTRCPRCRSYVFPNLDFSAQGDANLHTTHGAENIDLDGNASANVSASTPSNTRSSRYVRAPLGQNNLLRLQEILQAMRTENSINEINAGQIEESTTDELGIHNSESAGIVARSDQQNSFRLSNIVVIERSPPARF